MNSGMSRTTLSLLALVSAVFVWVLYRQSGTAEHADRPSRIRTVGAESDAQRISSVQSTGWMARPELSTEQAKAANAASAASADVDDGSLGRDPDGARAVLALAGKPLGTPAEKLTAIRAAIAASGPCSDSDCMITKHELLARVDLAAARSGGRLSLRSTDCYQVGCVVEITARDAAIQMIVHQLQAEGQLEWPVPAIYAKPVVADDGTQSAFWVFFNPN